MCFTGGFHPYIPEALEIQGADRCKHKHFRDSRIHLSSLHNLTIVGKLLYLKKARNICISVVMLFASLLVSA